MNNSSFLLSKELFIDGATLLSVISFLVIHTRLIFTFLKV